MTSRRNTQSNERATQTEWIRSVVSQYETPLLRYAAGIVGDADRARDVVQDAFLRLWARPPSDDRVAQWLFTVCRNRALDVVRKERRMKPLTDTDRHSQVSSDPSPPASAVRAESVGQVTAALAELPDNQREVLRLKFQSGFSYKEIAGVTGLTVSNVGFLIHVGIKELRSRFQALGLLGEKEHRS